MVSKLVTASAIPPSGIPVKQRISIGHNPPLRLVDVAPLQLRVGTLIVHVFNYITVLRQ